MRLYSELTDLPPRYGFSSVKNKGKILNFCKTDVVESFEGKFDDGSNGLMFLSERRSLRSYDLSEIDAFRKSVGLQTLGIICTWLSAPWGSGNRRWVNMQDEKTNFNANIFLQIDRRVWSPKESFSLQEKISVGIARTLESYLKIEGITIHYPFHFLYHQGKVAGHLIQTCNTADGIAMRIGVGINTDFAPELPENDELVKYIYKSPTSLGMKPDDWGDLYRRLRYNILECLSMESCHEPYKNLLTVKAGRVVQVYRDSGTIHLGKPLTHAMVMEITEEGNLVMDDGKTYNTEHHVQTN